MVVTGLKMAKKHQHSQILVRFLPFLNPLQPLKHYQAISIL